MLPRDHDNDNFQATYDYVAQNRKYKKKAKEMKDLLSKAAQELNGVDDELVNQIQTVIEKRRNNSPFENKNIYTSR